MQASSNVREYLFLKKMITFLNGIKDINPQKRKKEIDKIDSSKKYRIKVGEKLLYILDRSDDYEKAEYIAKLFVTLLEEKISYDDFIRGSNAINTLSIPDFRLFLSYDTKTDKIYLEDATLFVAVGLMFFDSQDVIVEDNDDYEISDKYKVSGGGLDSEFSALGYKIRTIFNIA